MENKIIKLIAEMLGKKLSEIQMKSRFIEDLKADSLDILEMMLTLEEEFNVIIKDEDVSSIKTVEDIINYIKAYN